MVILQGDIYWVELEIPNSDYLVSEEKAKKFFENKKLSVFLLPLFWRM